VSEKSSLAKLVIQRRIEASVETVFEALTRPEKMNQWFFGMPGGRAEVEQDFRVGGSYVARMFKPDGSEGGCEHSGESAYAPHGEYLEIDAPWKLVFTWISEGFVDYSVVTIRLEEAGEATRLTLEHELPAGVADAHEEGWTACLEHLRELLEG